MQCVDLPMTRCVRKIGIQNLALALASMVLTLACLEAGVRIAAPQNLWYFDVRRIRHNAWEFIPSTEHPNYAGASIRINNAGLRGDDIAVPKPQGAFRIIAVGDSVTFGYGVPHQNTFTTLLQARLSGSASNRRYEVLNAGVGGTGLDYYHHYITRMAPKLKPDLLLVCISMNDIQSYPDRMPEVPPALPRTRVDSWLLSHSHLYSLVYTRLKSVLYGFGVLDIKRGTGLDYLAAGAPSQKREPAWDSSLAYIRRTVDAARERQKTLVLVIFPLEPQLSVERLSLYQQRFRLRLGPEALSGTPQRRLQSFAREQGIAFIDLLPAFRAESGKGLFLRNVSINFDPIHLSIVGHSLAADEIYRGLTNILARTEFPRYPGPAIPYKILEMVPRGF